MTVKYFKILSLFFAMLLVGCASDDATPPSGSSNVEDSDRVVFGAKVIEMGNTRAIGDKTVKDKKLNLLFLSSNGWESGFADFNYQGIAYSERYDNNGSVLDLLWSYVAPDEYNGETYSFFLDNIPDEFNIPDPNDITKVIFNEGNPYKASRYVDENNKNDLWWGSLQGVNRAKIENIDLYHVMARVSLKVYFDNSAVGDSKYPVSATINNIYRYPVSFDRLTGNLGLPEAPDPEPFTLVEDEQGWEETLDVTGLTYYTSPDYILPPQEFVSNARPRLSVVVKNGNTGELQTFSGLLPLAMYLEGENGSSTLWTMSFLKGYSLTLTVKISNEAADLQFLPVTLLEWWPVGSKTLTGIQASVRDDNDLDTLIKTYNTSVDDSEFYNWGYKDSTDGVWYFNVFRNINIEASKYAGKMTERTAMPYGFKLHSASVVVTLKDGTDVYLTGEEGERQLKALLNEGTYPTKQ